jgi:alkaline phosphatase
MRKIVLAAALLVPFAAGAAQGPAKNVVLFLADAGGIPTISAASLHGYGAPRRLFIQRMPNIGLSDTTPAVGFVTDSSAGMTAIVTGQKTRNGVVAQSATARRKVRDGEPLKTILEYAEEHGLSTGIITNDSVTGATPASLYAKANDRGMTAAIFQQVFTPRFGDGPDVVTGATPASLYAKANDRGMTAAIFQQVFTPRFGDGPDVVIGAGRASIIKALTEAKLDLETLGREKGRPVLRSLTDITPEATRALVVLASGEYDLQAAIDVTTRILARNPKGYFLMVEWDTHTDQVRSGLDRMVAIDKAIERTAQTAGTDTLILFTADHSFDLRVRGEDSAGTLLAGIDAAQAAAKAAKRSNVQTKAVRMQDDHTGEEVLVAAQGPGAERVKGYLANTDLFGIMMDAFGWKAN